MVVTTNKNSLSTGESVVPIRTTTTWPNGQESKIELDYDSGFAAQDGSYDANGNWIGQCNTCGTGLYGLVTATREYGFGSGAPGRLVRTISTPRLALSNPPYLNNNLLNLPSNTVITDTAGTVSASTIYGYDESVLDSSGISTQHDLNPPAGTARGNITSASRLLETAGRLVVSNIHWFDTGEVSQEVDPLQHATSHSYDGAYAGAYRTKTCDALNHCVSATYDLNTGLITGFTDANATLQASGNTPGDPSHTISYNYDNMLRLTKVSLPRGDGSTEHGQTSFCYSDTPGTSCSAPLPAKVITTKAIDALHNAVSTTVFDGLGRPTQTVASDPEGDTFTETIYDGLGRIRSVTNPHRAAPSATDGTTATTYDALGRVISVTQPDHSLLQNRYDDPDSTTYIDEGGHQRRILNDVFGQVIEVNEPGDPSASPPPGWNSSSPSVVIDGAEGSATVDPCADEEPPIGQPPRSCPHTIWDSGNVSITVSGFRKSAGYGLNSTSNSIASDLATAFNGDPNSPVTAGASGNIVTFTSRDPNFAINSYSLLAASATNDFGTFGGASFTASVPNAQSTLDHSPSVTLETYDALGDLLCVEQHGNASTGTGCAAPPSSDATSPWRVRRFTYDSLSRLLAATNPESGLIRYGYDANGNMISKTALAPNQPAGSSATITTSFSYDALNRLTYESFSDGTYRGGFTYDETISNSVGIPVTNGIGRLTSSWEAWGGQGFSYDALGRLIQVRRAVGHSLDFFYSYNLNGSVKSLHYPSGRVVNYGYDAAGHALSAIDSNGTQYVSNATYWPSGAQYQTWNPKIYFRTDLNKRLQIAGFYSDNGQVGSFYLNKTYNYGAQNNGNVLSITNNKDPNRTENFTYDALNRITAGWVNANTGPLSWGENYSIDAWGNLMMSPMLNKAHGGNFQCAGDAQNHATCLSYDAAGNVTSNGGAAYTYDAGNMLKTVGTISYLYDADGQRFAKWDNGVPVKSYFYGANGEVLAEGAGSSNLTAEYIYFNGKRVARVDLPGNAVHYYLSDHLGSTSMVVSAAGAIEDESDYSPFGTEYAIASAGQNPFKFTGKERDSESGNDYFNARYYASSMGRFMTPDFGGPLEDIAPDPVPWADFEDPQSLNLYGYAHNNPVTNSDPDGHDCVVQTRTSDKSESVSVSSGTCNGVKTGDGQSATYVPGTVNSVQAGQDGRSIDIGYTPYQGGGTGVFNANAAPYPDRPGLAYGFNQQGYRTLGTAGATMNDPRTYAAWFGASAVVGGALVASGAIGGGTLTTLAGEDGLGLAGRQAINRMIGDSQRALLREFFKTGKLPEGLSQRSLQLAKTLAQRAIAAGKDQLGVQAQRLQMINNVIH